LTAVTLGLFDDADGLVAEVSGQACPPDSAVRGAGDIMSGQPTGVAYAGDGSPRIAAPVVLELDRGGKALPCAEPPVYALRT